MSEFWEMARVTLFGSSNSASRGGAAAFEPARDIPSLAGKVVLITGAAGDLGRQTAIELARHGRPSRIYVADLPRDDEAKKALARQIAHEAYGDAPTGSEGTAPPTEIRFLDLDLASLASVRKCAADFAAQESQLDVLLLNAGIIQMAPRLTTDGYEAHFGINYLGHALLARLLAPTLVRTAERQPGTDVRIVVVSSEGHIMTPKGGIDFDQLKTTCAKMDYAKRYGQSKVALIGLMRHLNREYPQFKTVAIHPGRIITGMARGLEKESALVRWTKPIAPLLCVPVAVGIRNHLWAATSPDISSGMYYEPVGVPGRESSEAKDESLSKRLREWTDNALVGIEPLE